MGDRRRNNTKFNNSPPLTEVEFIRKLANHFEQNIRVAVMTRAISQLEDLLVLLSQWEDLGSKGQGPGLSKTYENTN